VREYGIFHPLLYSFFSRSLYRDVGLNWRGLGFLYLLLLLTLSWIPAAVTIHRTVGIFVDNLGPPVLEQIPTLTVTDGEISVREPQPYLIRVPGSDAPLAVIDTTGGTSLADFPDARLFVGHRAISLRESGGKTNVYDLSNIRSFALDRARVERWASWLRKWGAAFLFPFLLLGSFACRIVQVLIYGALGILFSRVEKADLEYSDLVRLAAIAITPPVLLDTLRGWMGWPTSYLWWLACFAIAMAYLFSAVRLCATTAGEPGAAGSEPA
jgi:hypothetical protein